MTNAEYYQTFFKRKSIRKFDAALTLSVQELADIQSHLQNLLPLLPEIRTEFQVVKRGETTSKRGEYCLLLYSEQAPLYLLNAGYLMEQMDLYLESRNIGVCWYGAAKPKQLRRGNLGYVMMLAFGKSSPQEFRKGMSAFHRKAVADIWTGEFCSKVKQAVRLAPSAYNTQSWRFVSEGSQIHVLRNTKLKSFLPFVKLPYYNSIDLGISLFYLEVALSQAGYSFERTLLRDANLCDGLMPIADYCVTPSLSCDFASLADIEPWMTLVQAVRDNFPGLDETAYRAALAKSIAQREALLAKENGQVMGVLAFSKQAQELSFLAVHPAYRKRGIATALLQKLFTQFSPGTELSVLTYREGDPAGAAARALYLRMGFREAGVLVAFDYPCQTLTYTVDPV